jgi:LysB family phage lysis regulatory protein
MNTLNFLKPFAKPLIALLVLVFLYFAFQYYNHIQQKIGQLEQQLIQKQEQLQTQNQNIENIRTQLLKQYQAIADLQKVQSEIQTSAGQRQVLLKEIFSNDETSKTWASQPVPNAIRGMFNSAQNTTSATLSNAYTLP